MGGRRVVLTYTWLPPAERRPWRIGAHRLRWDGERFCVERRERRLLGPRGVEKQRRGWSSSCKTAGWPSCSRIWPNMYLAVFDSLDDLWDADNTYWGPYMG